MASGCAKALKFMRISRVLCIPRLNEAAVEGTRPSARRGLSAASLAESIFAADGAELEGPGIALDFSEVFGFCRFQPSRPALPRPLLDWPSP